MTTIIASLQDGYNSQSTRFAMMDTDIQDLVRIRILFIALVISIKIIVKTNFTSSALKGANPQGRADDWSGGLQTFHAQQRWQVTKHFLLKHSTGGRWLIGTFTIITFT